MMNHLNPAKGGGRDHQPVGMENTGDPFYRLLTGCREHHRNEILSVFRGGDATDAPRSPEQRYTVLLAATLTPRAGQ